MAKHKRPLFSFRDRVRRDGLRKVAGQMTRAAAKAREKRKTKAKQVHVVRVS